MAELPPGLFPPSPATELPPGLFPPSSAAELPPGLFPATNGRDVPHETPPGYAVHVLDIIPALRKWWDTPSEPGEPAPPQDALIKPPEAPSAFADQSPSQRGLASARKPLEGVEYFKRLWSGAPDGDTSKLGRIPFDTRDVLHEGIEAGKKLPETFAREHKDASQEFLSIIKGDPLAGRGIKSAQREAPSQAIQTFFDVAGAPIKGPARSLVTRPIAEKLGTTPQAVESVTDLMLPGLGIVPYSRMGRLFNRPRSPVHAWTDTVSDDLHRVRTSATADRAELLNTVRAMPEEVRTGPVQEALYDATEMSHLPFAQAAVELERLHPELADPANMARVQQAAQLNHALRLEASNIYNNLRGLGIPDTDLVDSQYIHRRAVGHTPAVDEPGAVIDPIAAAGGAQRTLPRSTSALQERRFRGGEDPAGNRVIISEDRNSGQLMAHTGTGAATPVARISDTEFSHAGRTYTIGSATTREIEAATAAEPRPTTYHKNALANTVDALARLRAVQRHVELLDNIMATPEWSLYATQRADVARRIGWHQSVGPPQLDGWYMHPRLEAAFNDFYRPGFAGRAGSDPQRSLEAMRKVNHFAIGSLFWNPTPHIENVLGHWVVGRGWDWITPQGVRSLVQDGARAIRAVTTQNGEYQRMLRAGSGMIFGGVRNADFYQDVARLAGMDIQRQPFRWDPIARTLGLGPSDLVRAIYEGSRRTLWWANDVFMMQRVFELERQGMRLPQAIREAEKHIPNYRIPQQVMGSRVFSQVLQEPAITVFSRYHYGVFNSYANMIRDMVAPMEAGDRFKAIGNMMALGLLTWWVYPLLDDAIQKLHGDDTSKKLRRGPAAFPTAVQELFGGDKTWPETISGTIQFTPLVKAAGSLGHDAFTGQPISEPGSTGLEQAGQAADWTLGQLVQPYQLLNQRPEDQGGRSMGRVLSDSLLGEKNTSDASLRGKQIGKKIERKRENKRQTRDKGGPIERGIRYLGVD